MKNNFYRSFITKDPKNGYENLLIKGSNIISMIYYNHVFHDSKWFFVGRSLASICDAFKIENVKIKDFVINRKKYTSMDIC